MSKDKYRKNGRWYKKNELESILLLTNWINNDTLKGQIQNYFYWSISKAWKYLTLYSISNILSIILPATIPVIIELRELICGWQYIITIISFLSSILVASSTALKVRALWNFFRNVAEQLKSECLECAISAGKYAGLESEEKERKLCTSVEEIHQVAVCGWKEIYSK